MCDLNPYDIVETVFAKSKYGAANPCRDCPWIRRMRMNIGVQLAQCTLQEYKRSPEECRGFDTAAEEFVRKVS